jgi:hypothetical protein
MNCLNNRAAFAAIFEMLAVLLHEKKSLIQINYKNPLLFIQR